VSKRFFKAKPVGIEARDSQQTDEQSKAWKAEVTFLLSHSYLVTESESKQGQE
jgi:hypothetical protein